MPRAVGPNTWVLGCTLPGCMGACTLKSHPTFLTPVWVDTSIPSNVECGKQQGTHIQRLYLLLDFGFVAY